MNDLQELYDDLEEYSQQKIMEEAKREQPSYDLDEDYVCDCFNHGLDPEWYWDSYEGLWICGGCHEIQYP
jgi:hypothetical protein